MDTSALVSVEEYLHTSYPDGDREYVDGRIVERNMGEVDHGDAQTQIAVYLANHYPQLWVGVQIRVQVRPARCRVPDITLVLGPKPTTSIIMEPPLAVVEVISKDDRPGDLQQRIEDYLAFGIPNIWAVNPRFRQAHIHTPQAAFEVKDGILRIHEPLIEVPLSRVLRPTHLSR
jgi:Uma2 family endonuclease